MCPGVNLKTKVGMITDLEDVPGVGPGIAKKLRTANITTVELLAVQHHWELKTRTGISEETAIKIIKNARQLSGMFDFKSGLKKEADNQAKPRLKTGIQDVDGSLMGGLEIGSLIEFYGRAAGAPAKWLEILGGDPRIDLLQCDESFTIFRTLVDLLEIPVDKDVIESVRELVLADEKVNSLVNDLPADWSTYLVKGHDKADYPPSILLLLFDFGVQANDFPQINELLDQMRSLQDDDGRFLSLARFPGKDPAIGSSFCDTHIITEVLIRGGYVTSSEVRNAIAMMSDKIDETNQGLAWKCEPNSATGARGPGRKDDLCPQATLEALRVFSLLPEKERPTTLLEAGKTLLGCWERRKTEKPYLFGQGSRFKKLRPPFFWYNIGYVLDTFSHYPEFFHETPFEEMIGEMVQAADTDGKFIPGSVYRHFKEWSFGQKKEWSPWTTMYACRILKRVYS